MQLLYYSIFHCHLIYAVTIWSCLHSGPINDLFKLQKTAIRLISGSSYNSHTEPLFKKLKILPLPDLVAFSKVQFMQRFSQKMLPSSSMPCGFATLFGTLAITRYNYAILPSYKTIIRISSNLMSFLYTAFQKSGRNLLMKISKLSGRRLILTASSKIIF